MRKERNIQSTGSNPVPTTTIFCNNDKSDSPSAFFLFTNTSYLEVSVMVAAAVEYFGATFLCIQVIEFSKITNAGNIINMVWFYPWHERHNPPSSVAMPWMIRDNEPHQLRLVGFLIR